MLYLMWIYVEWDMHASSIKKRLLLYYSFNWTVYIDNITTFLSFLSLFLINFNLQLASIVFINKFFFSNKITSKYATFINIWICSQEFNETLIKFTYGIPVFNVSLMLPVSFFVDVEFVFFFSGIKNWFFFQQQQKNVVQSGWNTSYIINRIAFYSQKHKQFDFNAIHLVGKNHLKMQWNIFFARFFLYGIEL